MKKWYWIVVGILLAILLSGNSEWMNRNWQAKQLANKKDYQDRLAMFMSGPSEPDRVHEHDTPYRMLMRHGWKEEELTQGFAEDLIYKRNPGARFWAGNPIQVPLPDRHARG